jgi:hypothetical protein
MVVLLLAGPEMYLGQDNSLGGSELLYFAGSAGANRMASAGADLANYGGT